MGEINGIGILSTLKSEKSFPFWKTFRNLMLKANQAIRLSSIFVSGFGAKRGLVNEGTLCKSATVPAAVIL